MTVSREAVVDSGFATITTARIGAIAATTSVQSYYLCSAEAALSLKIYSARQKLTEIFIFFRTTEDDEKKQTEDAE